MKKVVTRFAPSPTGFLHIGAARTALFAYLFAKQHKGAFILRLEDTDQAREVAGAKAHIQEALRWLGITWDYGPDKPGPFGSCVQSERRAVYRRYAEQLLAAGLAYPDPYSPEEVATWREQASVKKRPFLFRHHRPDKISAWDGTRPLRFLVPNLNRVSWHDAVRGELSAGEEMLDDFIILKADGLPTYNFAHVVDDHKMGVTHVMRGEEFIASTPKFIRLYEAFNWPLPTFVTLPPILGPDGKKKLSKRDGAKDLLSYRDEGYLPAALRNFLALIGWNPGTNQELFSEAELLTAFSLERIQKSGGAFNEEKLNWMNKTYLTQLSPEDKTNYFISALPEAVTALSQYSSERATKLATEALERACHQRDIIQTAKAGEYHWAFTPPTVDPELLKWKKDPTLALTLERIVELARLLAEADFSSPETIKASVWAYVEEVGRGEALWPLRVALTGRQHSPDPFTCAWVLGAIETQTRLRAVLTTTL